MQCNAAGRRCFPLPGKPAGCCEPAVPWNLVLECGSRPSHDGDAVVPRFIQFSARTSGVNECTVGGRTQPATNDPGRLRAHLSCKRAALSAHKRDLSPRRGGETGREWPHGLGCGRGGVGQPDTLPPRPAAGSKHHRWSLEAWKAGRKGSCWLFELMTRGQDGPSWLLGSIQQLDRWTTAGRRKRSPAPTVFFSF